MMGLFDIYAVSGSGVNLNRTWMDAISDNIANVNTVRSMDDDAFQSRYVIAQAVDATPEFPGGVAVAGIALGDPEGMPVYDPGHPLANEDGMVRRPAVDLGEQMTQLIMAQRGYQANLAVVQRATDAYQAAMQLGK
jgi:flagellar basal-body rod protein FlgC